MIAVAGGLIEVAVVDNVVSLPSSSSSAAASPSWLWVPWLCGVKILKVPFLSIFLGVERAHGAAWSGGWEEVLGGGPRHSQIMKNDGK